MSIYLRQPTQSPFQDNYFALTDDEKYKKLYIHYDKLLRPNIGMTEMKMKMIGFGFLSVGIAAAKRVDYNLKFGSKLWSNMRKVGVMTGILIAVGAFAASIFCLMKKHFPADPFYLTERAIEISTDCKKNQSSLQAIQDKYGKELIDRLFNENDFNYFMKKPKVVILL